MAQYELKSKHPVWWHSKNNQSLAHNIHLQNCVINNNDRMIQNLHMSEHFHGRLIHWENDQAYLMLSSSKTSHIAHITCQSYTQYVGGAAQHSIRVILHFHITGCVRTVYRTHRMHKLYTHVVYICCNTGCVCLTAPQHRQHQSSHAAASLQHRG